MKGYIHSVESFGTVDGPGIRYVVFMQGCPLRCKYCHNPDTWQTKIGKEVSVDELLEEYHNNSSFYQKGGITVTGGEPLLQIEFVTELLKAARKKNIHTCIDTSGIVYNPNNQAVVQKFNDLLKYTNLVMLDIKHIDSEKHKQLTGADNKNILAFAKWLSDNNKKMWIRHVLVPDLTDSKEELINIKNFISKLDTVERIEVLPYHSLGIHKWEKLGIDYKLKNTKAPTNEEMNMAKQIMDLI